MPEPKQTINLWAYKRAVSHHINCRLSIVGFMFWLKWFQQISQKKKLKPDCAICNYDRLFFNKTPLYIYIYMCICGVTCIVDWVVRRPAVACWDMGMKWRCCRGRLSLLLPQINYSVTIGVCLIWELISFARQMAQLLAIMPSCCHDPFRWHFASYLGSPYQNTHIELWMYSC